MNKLLGYVFVSFLSLGILWYTHFNRFFWFGLPCFLLIFLYNVLIMVEGSFFLKSLRVSTCIGLILNGLALSFNGGYMPVRVVKAIDASLVVYGAHCLATPASRLLALCDIYYLGVGYFSLGDFFLLGGLFLYLGKPIYDRIYDRIRNHV